MKTLIYVPIIHNFADMGYSKEVFSGLNFFWDLVEEGVDGLNLDYTKVRLYNDSIDKGFNLGLIQKLADLGSRNFRLINKLINMGAVLEVTESELLLHVPIEILLKFRKFSYEPGIVYEFRKKLLIAFWRHLKLFTRDFLKNKNLPQRDQYIADRIVKTLKDGEIGILFIGAMHEAEKYLPEEINVIHLPRVELELIRIWSREMLEAKAL